MTEELLEIAGSNRDEFLTLDYTYGKTSWWKELTSFAKNNDIDNFIKLWATLLLNDESHLVCQEELYEIWNYYRGPFRETNWDTKMIEPCENFMKMSYRDFEKLTNEFIDKSNADK